MSRTKSNFSQSENPCKIFLEWESDNKRFKYWNREKAETIYYNLPIHFIPLDRHLTVKGWSDEENSKIYSNGFPIENAKTSKLKVKAGKTVIAEGIWSEIKNQVKAAGGKYTEAVYGWDVNKNELICFLFNASSLSGGGKEGVPAAGGWMKYTMENPKLLSENNIVNIIDSATVKNKAIKFNVPVIVKGDEATEKQMQDAILASELIDKYIESTNNASKKVMATNEAVINDSDDLDDIFIDE